MEREIKSDIFKEGRVINSQRHKFIAIYLSQKFANQQMRVHFGCYEEWHLLMKFSSGAWEVQRDENDDFRVTCTVRVPLFHECVPLEWHPPWMVVALVTIFSNDDGKLHNCKPIG